MKRFLCVIAAAAMLSAGVSLFASGQQGGASNLSDIGFNATGYPVVTKPYTFTASVLKRPLHGAYDNMEALTNMEKKTGVHVQWIEIPEAGFRERMNMMLASDDLPDVFMSGVQDSDVLRYGPQGTFLALDNLIESYAPLIKELFEKRPEIKQYVTAPDRHVYVLPRVQELGHRVNGQNMFINKTWLDKLGLGVPSTYDELYNALKAFKTRDPNGNGRADEIPLAFTGISAGVGSDITPLFAGFGMFDNATHIMVANGKVYFTANSPEFKNALTYFNKLNNEGLLDPEAFTQDVRQYTAKGMDSEMLCGVFFNFFDENMVGIERAKRDYIALPPMIGVDGKRHWETDPNAVLARENFSITNKMKNPEVAIRWADFCYDWATSFELCYGPWGICLEQRGEQIIQLPPPAGMSPDEYRYLHTPAHTTPFAVYEADHLNMSMGENHARKFERLAMYRQYFPALSELYPRVYFLLEEESELATIRTDIQDYVSQMRAKFIIGSESLATGWDTYIATLNQMGLSRYLEIHQIALDRYNAN